MREMARIPFHPCVGDGGPSAVGGVRPRTPFWGLVFEQSWGPSAVWGRAAFAQRRARSGWATTVPVCPPVRQVSYLAAALALLLFAGCAPKGADRVARGFVDAYYIEFDVASALAYCAGMAKRRLEAEAPLVEQARKQLALTDAKTRVYYDAPERHETDKTQVHYTFRLASVGPASRTMTDVVVMVAKRGEAWKVIRFREDNDAGKSDP